MLRLLLTRALSAALVLATLSVGLFAILSLLPGDPVEMFILSNPRVRQEDVARLRRLRGLDAGFTERYARWLFGHHPPVTPVELAPPEPIAVELSRDNPATVTVDVRELVAPALRPRFDARAAGATEALSVRPLLDARADGTSVSIVVREPGHARMWFAIVDARGLETVSCVDVVARLARGDVRQRLASPNQDERLVETSPELDLDVLDPEPAASPRAIPLLPTFFVDERVPDVDLTALTSEADAPPLRFTLIDGPGRIDGLRYVPPPGPGRHAVVVHAHFADGERVSGAFTVETGPIADEKRFEPGFLAVFTGDLAALGHSSAYKRPIEELLIGHGANGRLVMTFALVTPALALAVLLALVLGVQSALRRGSALDRAVLALSTTFLALPSFWIGLLALVVFAEWTHLAPAGGAATPGLEGGFLARLIDRAHHLALPVVVLGLTIFAPLVRHVRGALVDVLSAEFLVAARARGIPERTIVWRHALRHALPPVVAAVSLTLPALVGGALLTETVFSWPGVGRLQYEAVLANDSYLAVVLFLLEAAAVLAAALLADVALYWLDPRTREHRT